MTETLIRFLVGGLTVSVFALVGDLVKPKSFAGLFGAAPAVAIASLGLAVATQGRSYASLECRSMLAGAAALGLYSGLVSYLLLRRRIAPLPATLVFDAGVVLIRRFALAGFSPLARYGDSG